MPTPSWLLFPRPYVHTFTCNRTYILRDELRKVVFESLVGRREESKVRQRVLQRLTQDCESQHSALASAANAVEKVEHFRNLGEAHAAVVKLDEKAHVEARVGLGGGGGGG